MGDPRGATGDRATPAALARPSLPTLLTTAEAAAYLRFRSSSGIRTAVMRGELHPVGAGAKRSHLFTVAELDRFVSARAARYPRGRLGTPGDRMERSCERQGTDTLSGRVLPRPGDVLDPCEGGRPAHGQEQGDRSGSRRGDRPRGRAEAPRPHRRGQADGSASPEGAGWGIRAIVDRIEDAKARLDDSEDVRRRAGETYSAGARELLLRHAVAHRRAAVDRQCGAPGMDVGEARE